MAVDIKAVSPPASTVNTTIFYTQGGQTEPCRIDSNANRELPNFKTPKHFLFSLNTTLEFPRWQLSVYVQVDSIRFLFYIMILHEVRQRVFLMENFKSISSQCSEYVENIAGNQGSTPTKYNMRSAKYTLSIFVRLHLPFMWHKKPGTLSN